MKIFISGASSGLGFYLTEKFILEGDSVWGIGRRKFELDNIEKNSDISSAIQQIISR